MTRLITITAMDLRKEPGSFLDRVDYRNEHFLVKRAGKPKAVIISVSEYELNERRKRVARENYWAMSEDLRKRVARYDPAEVQAAIDAAIQAVRREQRKQKR